MQKNIYVYIPKLWFIFNVESLEHKLLRLQADINEPIGEAAIEVNKAQIAWIEERIPIVKLEALIKGEPE